MRACARAERRHAGAASAYREVAPDRGAAARLRAGASSAACVPGAGRPATAAGAAPRRLEVEFTRLVRTYAPLRRAMAALAHRLVLSRGWERLGFARLSDYATERLGLSGRSLHDLAHVHRALENLPGIDSAFVSGRIPWTTTRLLARVATPADECQWLDRARGMTAAALAGEVRRVDVGARALGALGRDDTNDDDDADAAARARENILIRCTPPVRSKWYRARQLAWRVVGHPVPPWECAELVAAEVLSALPIDGIARGDSARGDEGRRGPVVEPADDPMALDEDWRHPANDAADEPADETVNEPLIQPLSQPLSQSLKQPLNQPLNQPANAPATKNAQSLKARSFAVPARGLGPKSNAGPLAASAATANAADAFGGGPAVTRWTAAGDPSHAAHQNVPWLHSLVSSLLENVETAGPFQLDRRLRRAVRLEQRLDAELGEWFHGIARFDVYVREWFGLAPRRVRALLRLERTRRTAPALAQAYRDGRLSWVQAHALIPVLLIAHGRPASDAWIARAMRVSVRRLQDDVDRALLLNELDPDTFARTTGLPADAGAEGISAGHSPRAFSTDVTAEGDAVPAGSDPPATERQIGALPTDAAPTSLLAVHAPRPVAQLFRAVLATVRRTIERRTGRLPSAGETFGAMLEHAIDAWAPPGSRPRAAHRIFARDGWRCTAPGCSSFRNLHDHHIVFRSAGGGNAPANRTTLCAWHHLRGIHAGIMRCRGAAPHRLRFELGIRSDGPPLVTFGPGERIESGGRASQPARRAARKDST